MGVNIFRICNSSQAPQIKRLTSYIPIAIRRYGHFDNKERKHNSGVKEKQGQNDGQEGQNMAERAPSTAEEFERVAEAKTRKGFASQTIEKSEDGFKEAASPDSNSKSVKESFKEPPGALNFRKTGDERDPS